MSSCNFIISFIPHFCLIPIHVHSSLLFIRFHTFISSLVYLCTFSFLSFLLTFIQVCLSICLSSFPIFPLHFHFSTYFQPHFRHSSFLLFSLLSFLVTFILLTFPLRIPRWLPHLFIFSPSFSSNHSSLPFSLTIFTFYLYPLYLSTVLPFMY